MNTTPEPQRVVLAGVHGYGRNYLPVLRELTAEGAATLVGVCDLRPVPAEMLEGLGTPVHGPDLGALVRETGADVAVIATPLHTHTALGLAALEAGAHLQLEKPPAVSLAEFDALREAADQLGRVCQVGFQSLGSGAPDRVRDLVRDGAIGTVRGIGAHAAWSRDTAYYQRAPWAGRRRLDGVDVVDGALTNPLAHAVATVLALDGGAVESVETELYRAFDNETDDTSCVRVHTSGGLAQGRPLVVAATLAAPVQQPPVITVHGDAGSISYWYTEDRVRLTRPGAEPEETTHGRAVLLRNLLSHLAAARDGAADPAPLLVPLASTEGFMRVLESVRTAPDPRQLPAEDLPGEGGARRRVIPGITEVVTEAAEQLALYSELPRFAALAGRAA
ncbi:Gfo/Idh/MocA family protein [Streptomyces spiramenti]|uniref:Gfo/Idh/MocA family oxidoreductase n=1 Tax=Streptomyces spiramenti TaxID=2720606 RepID=A0ABX1AEW2_9ACTN|nr:Gfo/Idh/MocA family oxidoreductase [Streptomyces spiramenti]NJP65654.1 Gfo/Idh/MocA family oxidoreductase [Streptomyces spiramenti]